MKRTYRRFEAEYVASGLSRKPGAIGASWRGTMAERDCLPITITDSLGVIRKPGHARPFHGVAGNGGRLAVGGGTRGFAAAAKAGVAIALLLCVLLGARSRGLVTQPPDDASAWPTRPQPRGLSGLSRATNPASLSPAAAAAGAAAALPPEQFANALGRSREDILERAMAALPEEGVLTQAAASSSSTAPQQQHQQAPARPRRQNCGGSGCGSGSGTAHPFPQEAYRLYSIPAADTSPRCQRSGICDGDHGARGRCGDDGLACVVGTAERQQRVREAIRWSWQGYRCAARMTSSGSGNGAMGHSGMCSAAANGGSDSGLLLLQAGAALMTASPRQHHHS